MASHQNLMLGGITLAPSNSVRNLGVFLTRICSSIDNICRDIFIHLRNTTKLKIKFKTCLFDKAYNYC